MPMLSAYGTCVLACHATPHHPKTSTVLFSDVLGPHQGAKLSEAQANLKSGFGIMQTPPQAATVVTSQNKNKCDDNWVVWVSGVC